MSGNPVVAAGDQMSGSPVVAVVDQMSGSPVVAAVDQMSGSPVVAAVDQTDGRQPCCSCKSIISSRFFYSSLLFKSGRVGAYRILTVVYV